MIHEAKEELVEIGFTEMVQFEDSFGTIGYGLRFMGDDYILVAKQYAHDGLASFIERLVVGNGDVVDFIFYNDDEESFTVFDGQFVEKNADESSGPSKKRDCSWRELPTDHGVDLHDYIRGAKSPDTLSGKNESLESFV